MSHGRRPPSWLVERRALIDEQLAQVPLADGVIVEALVDAAVPGLRCRPEGPDAGCTILYLHGGGYRMGSSVAYRSYGSRLAAAASAEVIIPDYRLAPEHPFPTAVDDALAVYRGLIPSGTDRSLFVIGDSAGGGLTVAVLLAARDTGLPLPDGAITISPWVDLTNTGASFESNADRDQQFSVEAAREAAEMYLQGASPTEPLASPARADLSGLCAIHIMVGGAEVLIDDARLLHENARAAGCSVSLSEYPDQGHVWHLAPPPDPGAVAAMSELVGTVRAWIDHR